MGVLDFLKLYKCASSGTNYDTCYNTLNINETWANNENIHKIRILTKECNSICISLES